MPKTLQFRRGTTTELATEAGAVGELFVDTTKDTVVVMDGSTQGGFPLQNQLVSGTNIKTINGNSLLGSGDLTISGSGDVSLLDLTDVGADGSNGQVLTTDGSGNFTFTTVSGGGEADFSAIPEDMLPLFNDVYDIGSADARWFDLFISNSINLNGSSITASEGVISITDDIVSGSILADDLLFSDNLITPSDSSQRQYLGTKGVVVVNGNLDVEGDWLQLPKYGGTNDVEGTVTADVTGSAGIIRFNEIGGNFEGHDGTEWGSLGGISADEEGNATIDANLIVTGDVISLSDSRMKDNIEHVTDALSIIDEIEGVYYNLKTDPEKRHVGVIAQNIEKVLPEVVYESNGNKSVAYGNIVGVLIEAVKELKAEIKELKHDL